MDYGEDVTVVAEAKEGYKFIGWYEGDEQKSSEASYTLKDVKADTTLVAKFEKDSDPTGPTIDPTDPTTDPTDPANPTTDPTDPSDPSDPTDPDDPTNTDDPTTPSDRNDPTDPGDDDPTDDPSGSDSNSGGSDSSAGSSDPGKGVEASGASTGDDANPALWIVLAAIALGGGTGVTLYRRRKN